MDSLPRVSAAEESKEIGSDALEPSEKHEHGYFGILIAIPHCPGPLNFTSSFVYFDSPFGLHYVAVDPNI
jgi:hypothetical protein